MSVDILVARGVSVQFGAFKALDGIELRIREGTVHSLIGPNGAGKTTLFNALCGMVRLSRGEVHFDGTRVDRLSVASRSRLGMSRSFQITNLFFDVDVRENVRLAHQATLGLKCFDFLSSCANQKLVHERVDQVLEWAGLSKRADALAGELSHGEQRRLEMALAVASEPAVLFLDEPTAGMGAEDISFAKKLITSLSKERGMTIVLIEHNMSIVMDISDTITVLQMGQKIAEGKPETIQQDPRVRAAYLGE